MHDLRLAVPHLSQRFVTIARHIIVLGCIYSCPHPHLQIKAIEDDIRVAFAILRRHINLLESPLYRLPPDLLPEVASHLTSEGDLVNATHVSHHLRNTLLSFPCLWSHLNFKHETRAHGFFERSGQASLHVDMAPEAARTVTSLAELRKQSKRIATLKLRHWLIQKKFLSEPLPSLKRLEIYLYLERYDDEWDEERDDAWDEEWDITTPILGPMKKATSWSFPSLTSLIIFGLDPTPFHAPNLTRFKFWDLVGLINTEKLIVFLNDCPLLEHIDISYVDKFGLGTKSDLVVSLPSLRTYTQTDFGEVCPLTVFNTFSFPPFCSVTLRSQDDRGMTPAADSVLLPFKNPGYLAEIKRVKLRTTDGVGGGEVAEVLELINAKGTRVCSERMITERKHRSLMIHGRIFAINVAHLNFLQHINCQSVEILCIDGNASEYVGGVAVEFFKEVLGFGDVRTLILSRGSVGPCLLALDEDLGKPDRRRWFLSTHTLIIHLGLEQRGLHNKVLRPLLSIAQKRKMVGFPFKSVSLFLPSGLDETLDNLRSCVEKLEVVLRDDALDWDVDKYFLDGLEHLQKNRDVEWDR